jgi:hypothetical protein
VSNRWKLKQDRVTVGENHVDVRQLTHGERTQFVQASGKIRDGQMHANELPAVVLGFGCPGLSKDDIDSMPPELADAAVRKIMDLTGLKTEAAADDPGEKKE